MTDIVLEKQEQAKLDRALKGQGYNLRPLFELRRSLVARLGPEAGFAAWLDVAPEGVFPAGSGLAAMPLAGMAQAAHAQTLIAPAGRPIEAHPPKVIGPGNHRVLHNTGRAVYTGRLDGAVVRGASGAILAGGQLVYDAEGDEIARTDDAIDLDPAIVTRAPAGATAHAVTAADAPSIPEAFSLLGWSTGHFGHWMLEYLPRFALALAHGANPRVLLVDDFMPDSHYQALKMLAPDGAELHVVPRFSALKVDRLEVVSTLNYAVLAPQSDAVTNDQLAVDPALLSAAVTEMAVRMDRVLGPVTGGPDKVYLSRRAFGRRALVNADEIEDIARAAGFAIVQPETLGFAEQVRLMRGARVMVGPEGSSMMLGMFCRPGTTGILLNHEHTEGLATMSAALEHYGLAATVITGPQDGDDTRFAHNVSYRIDPALFTRVLDEVLAGARD